MKTINIFLVTILLSFSTLLLANQTELISNFSQENTESFNKIEIKAPISVTLVQGNEYKVESSNGTNLSNSAYKINNNTLIFNDNSALLKNIVVTFVDLDELIVNNAGNVKSNSLIEQPEFKINSNGASKINLKLKTNELHINATNATSTEIEIEADEIDCNVTGASKLTLKGTTKNLDANISGASIMNSSDLVCEDVDINLIGLSVADIRYTNNLESNVTGFSVLNYTNNTESNSIKSNDIVISRNDDTTTETETVVEINDGITKVKVGKRIINIDDDGVIIEKEAKKKRKNFIGHWEGFRMGINTWTMQDDNNLSHFNSELLDLNPLKSLNIQVNFLQLNQKIANNFGLVSGLGISWSNFRFDNNVKMKIQDNVLDLSELNEPDFVYKKSKMSVFNVNVPLILEFQIPNNKNKNKFFIGAGAMGSINLNPHSKNVFFNQSNVKIKEKQGIYKATNIFKADALAYIGYENIGLYAQYSLSNFFKANKAPKMDILTIGVVVTDIFN